MPSADADGSGSGTVVTVHGRLDAEAAVALENAVAEVIAGGATSVAIDLRAVTEWTEAGADGLVRCHRMASRLADGLHYHTGRGPGHEALLAAYADME